MAGTVPVTVLTGFLGAGKTTLVNRILAGSHGRRLAVIVNEFGELGIDAALISGASGSVIELANGCVCCATRGDLSRSIQEVLEAGAELDGILVETSGLADPGPVIEDLETLRFARDTRLDGVVTVLDAENFDRNLERAEAAYQQIAQADLLLINKTDLVSAEVPDLIENGVRRLNPRAGVLRCAGGDAPLDVVLGRVHEGASAAGHRHEHADEGHSHGSFESASLRVGQPLDEQRFTDWLDALPDTVYRAKGFVRFAGAPTPSVVHMVGARRSIEPAGSKDDVAGAALVVIGQSIAAADLQKGLEGCASG